MSVDCGACFAKILLCSINFTFFILGTVVLGLGIWLAADKSSFIALLKVVESDHLDQFTQPTVIEQMAYVLIVCGALIFFMSFLGYCGAVKESQCMLTAYAVLMIIVLVTQITIVGLAAAYKDRTRVETKKFLQSTITKYYTTSNETDAVSLLWNNMMTELNCCGVNDYMDFTNSEKWNQNKGNQIIPEVCCLHNNLTGDLYALVDTNCPVAPSDLNSNYRKGCYDSLSQWILSQQNILIIITVAIIFIELLLIFSSFCLCKSIDNYQVIRL